MASNDSDLDASMKTEVQDLCVYLKQIMTSMESVGKILTDTTESISSDGDLHDKVSQQSWKWGNIIMLVYSELAFSYQIAADALDTFNEFIQTILPGLIDDSTTIDERKANANAFISTLDSKESNAQLTSQALLNLQKVIGDFLEDTHTILAGYNVDNMEKRIQELNGLISGLVDDLNTYVVHPAIRTFDIIDAVAIA
ncbi:hypothetical protein K474DRAFT_1710825 [Panus rudis PR-1116 ss-1]|nr:hypothetical protein K474DRAFT_1710825 [Panus rudis PR-1116 ss-1]